MKVDYLRVSVTDRCNLRCVYCSPLGGRDFIEHAEILRFEEIYRIVRLFVRCGIKKVRLTGGEPLVRRNVVALVKQLSSIAGLEEFVLTTNGVLLDFIAAELKEAGIKRVNVSIEAAQRQLYEEVTGFDLLKQVTRGIDKAIQVGLNPVKINSVIIRNLNDDEDNILSLAQLSMRLPVIVRFIEYCPTSVNSISKDRFISAVEIQNIIERRFGKLTKIFKTGPEGPAEYFKTADAVGKIGFIKGRTEVFCSYCNRLRLSSDGLVKPCLYSAQQYDIKKLIRTGAGDAEIIGLIEEIIADKYNYTKLNSSANEFSMRRIGG